MFICDHVPEGTELRVVSVFKRAVNLSAPGHWVTVTNAREAGPFRLLHRVHRRRIHEDGIRLPDIVQVVVERQGLITHIVDVEWDVSKRRTLNIISDLVDSFDD